MLILYQRADAHKDSSYTLDQCLNYAFANQANVKNAVLDQQISKYKVNETRAYGLPQINFEGNTMYNVQLQPMFMTNQVANDFIGGGAPLPAGVDPNGTMAIPNLFQLKGLNTAHSECVTDSV